MTVNNLLMFEVNIFNLDKGIINCQNLFRDNDADDDRAVTISHFFFFFFCRWFPPPPTHTHKVAEIKINAL